MLPSLRRKPGAFSGVIDPHLSKHGRAAIGVALSLKTTIGDCRRAGPDLAYDPGLTGGLSSPAEQVVPNRTGGRESCPGQ